MSLTRRDILVGAGGIIAASAVDAVSSQTAIMAQVQTTHADAPTGDGRQEPATTPYSGARAFNGIYHGDYLNHIAFPMGGIGAGMICLEGTGALTKFSLRNRPDLGSEPRVFPAVSIQGPRRIARVLEGPVPAWKLRPFLPGVEGNYPGGCWGLPRFRQATFEARFPFGTVRLKEAEVPLEVELTGWSPFSPGDADNSSLPVAGIEYRFLNRSLASVDAVFSFHSQNFLAERHDLFKKTPSDRIRSTANGFILCGPGVEDRPWDDACLAAWVDDPKAEVNPAWIRGVDSMQIVWRDIESGAIYSRAPLTDDSSPGASVFVPFSVAPGEAKTISLCFAWYAPKSNLFKPADIPSDSNVVSCNVVNCTPVAGTYEPWYAGRFSSIEKLIDYWQGNYQRLRQAAEKFSRALYDTTLAPEVMEAIASNLSILKSPTVLRHTDGRLWGWEGSRETKGSCSGSCTHVWNSDKAIAHLFPKLEPRVRETGFGPNKND